MVPFGQVIIVEAFKLHKIMRAELIEQLLSRIVSKSDNTPHFIAILSSLIQEMPQMVLKFVQKVIGFYF